ncbi:MAG: DUF4395 domain-containing protein [Candidatus Nanopelagicales bacterium]
MSATETSTRQTSAPGQIDARGPRFGASITCLVLAAALLLGPRVGVWLVALQALVFLSGAVLGVQRQPYAVIYRTLVRPRLAPPTEFEDARPPRFAQAVGLAFAVAALIGSVAGLPALFYVATGMALAAAFLNAAFNFCLGCEFYLLIARARSGRAPA